VNPAARLDSRQLSLDLDAPPVTPSSTVMDPPASAPLPPQGDRRLLLDGSVLHYWLRRARRRTIGFTIDDRGLTISAPRWVTLREIEAAIVEKQRWIRTKLAEWREFRARQRLNPVAFVDGSVLPYLGRDLVLRLGGELRGTALRQDFDPHELWLALPREAAEHRVRDAVQGWLQGEARRILGARLQLLARRSRVAPAGWRLSSARSQWGACTHDRRISLNWRLIHFSLDVIDYVVAHELAHLAEMNHGTRFWHTVGELLPGFEPARDRIRQQALDALPL
jgi:hypothetical protein